MRSIGIAFVTYVSSLLIILFASVIAGWLGLIIGMILLIGLAYYIFAPNPDVTAGRRIAFGFVLFFVLPTPFAGFAPTSQSETNLQDANASAVIAQLRLSDYATSQTEPALNEVTEAALTYEEHGEFAPYLRRVAQSLDLPRLQMHAARYSDQSSDERIILCIDTPYRQDNNLIAAVFQGDEVDVFAPSPPMNVDGPNGMLTRMSRQLHQANTQTVGIYCRGWDPDLAMARLGFR